MYHKEPPHIETSTLYYHLRIKHKCWYLPVDPTCPGSYTRTVDSSLSLCALRMDFRDDLRVNIARRGSRSPRDSGVFRERIAHNSPGAASHNRGRVWLLCSRRVGKTQRVLQCTIDHILWCLLAERHEEHRPPPSRICFVSFALISLERFPFYRRRPSTILSTCLYF